MHEMFIQLFTFELAFLIDKWLSKMMGDNFSSHDEQNRLAAIVIALRNMDVLTVTETGQEMWFSHPFDDEDGDQVIQIDLTLLDMARAHKLSKRIMPSIRQEWKIMELATGLQQNF